MLTVQQAVRLPNGAYLNCDDRVKDANGKWVYKRDKVFSLTADEKFASCCDRGQTLFGSKDTAFICCGAGHNIAGSKEVGYTCCLEGQIYDGEKCKTPDPVCENGKELVDGKCVCPKGQEEGADGVCKPKAKCDSGIVSGMWLLLSSTYLSLKNNSGKCYTFTAENGLRYGYNNEGGYKYCPNVPNVHHFYGKFQPCIDEKCAGGMSHPKQLRDRRCCWGESKFRAPRLSS